MAKRDSQSEVTIVTYHYVRPLADGAFPALKGLDVALFCEQLTYLKAHYTPISMEQLLAALDGDSAVPARSVLLSFDDGYADHYDYAFPIMEELGFSGAFYPPANAVRDHELLDVNRLHFILASGVPVDELVASMEALVEASARADLESLGSYRATWAKPGRWDPAEVVYFKRMLQSALPEPLRHEIADTLFRRYVSADADGFAEELYLSQDQLREMISAGAHVGSHGTSHQRLSRLPAGAQRADIEASLDFLSGLGAAREGFTFCYPYGDYDSATVDILRNMGCRAALTLLSGIVEIGEDDPLLLKRLDTNDLPKDRNAPAPA